ncbi:ATP-binding protein [Gemmatimonas sp.]|uniref:ATP-binding protein n=1 Tax=Gemmatimonas sp. TaxID=1962908 RepID=UPI002ED8CD7B
MLTPFVSADVECDPVKHMSRCWVLSSELTVIPPVVEDIVTLCRDAGFSSKQCGLNVPVAVTEAMANAILRGNDSDATRHVEITVDVDEQRLVVDVCDEGEGFDLQQLQQSPDDADWFEREHGRGVFLMRNLMDHIENARRDGQCGHRLRLVLYRA